MSFERALLFVVGFTSGAVAGALFFSLAVLLVKLINEYNLVIG